MTPSEAFLADAVVHADLEAALAGVELQLGRLAEALHEGDSRGIDGVATALQRALGEALDRFARHARSGRPLPASLRRRLVLASGHVSAQRDNLARAGAALERAMDILLPREAAVYNARGAAESARQSGSVRA